MSCKYASSFKVLVRIGVRRKELGYRSPVPFSQLRVPLDPYRARDIEDKAYRPLSLHVWPLRQPVNPSTGLVAWRSHLSSTGVKMMFAETDAMERIKRIEDFMVTRSPTSWLNELAQRVSSTLSEQGVGTTEKKLCSG